MADKRETQRTAPFHTVPTRRIVSLEHPGIIRNVDRAIDTLQGNEGILKLLNSPKPDTPASLFLRPEDPMSRPLRSTSSPSNNVLLKVTVPKWTGRRRKKGSDGPFTSCPSLVDGCSNSQKQNARTRLRSLRDNVGKYLIEPVGRVERTHVFRGMPDFVFSTTSSPFTARFRKHILPFDFEKMKGFNLDMSKGAILNVDLVPPPSFSHGDVPFHYIYRQNPTVKKSVDTCGKVTIVNTQQAAKVLTYLVPYDIPIVPFKPQDDCPPISTLDRTLQSTIAALGDIFAERPAWTRRALRNHLSTVEQRYCLRYAVAYVGYIFRSGPWRDAIIKFGHDPRTSPEYRAYQTIMFRILPRESEVARDGGGGRRHTLPRPSEGGGAPDSSTSTIRTSTSHIFTGQPPLPLDGRMWMVCDITDPLLSGILFPPNPVPNFLRSSCEPICDGWYGSGTLAKVKTIMRAKVLMLTTENRATDDAEFVRLLTFPDHVAVEDNMADFTLDPEVVTSRDIQLAAELRSTIKGAANWRGMVTGGKSRGATTNLGVDQGGRPIATVTEKRVRWEDGGDVEGYAEDDSEGDEEIIEREEIEEAAAAAAAVETLSARSQKKETGGLKDVDDGEEYDDLEGEGDDGEGEDERDDDEEMRDMNLENDNEDDDDDEEYNVHLH